MTKREARMQEVNQTKIFVAVMFTDFIYHVILIAVITIQAPIYTQKNLYLKCSKNMWLLHNCALYYFASHTLRNFILIIVLLTCAKKPKVLGPTIKTWFFGFDCIAIPFLAISSMLALNSADSLFCKRAISK